MYYSVLSKLDSASQINYEIMTSRRISSAGISAGLDLETPKPGNGAVSMQVWSWYGVVMA